MRPRHRLLNPCTVALLVLAVTCPVHAARAQDSAAVSNGRRAELLARVAGASQERDSLSRLADKATGGEREVLEEQIWQKHQAVHRSLTAVAEELRDEKRRGADISSSVSQLEAAIRDGWARYQKQLDRRVEQARQYFEQRDAASGPEQLALERRLSAHADRSVTMFRELVGAVLALQDLGVDVAEQRAYGVTTLWTAADQTRTRLTLLTREADLVRDRFQRAPSDAAARGELESIEVGIKRASSAMEAEIDLLTRLGQDVTTLQVAHIVLTGKITTSAFRPPVIAGLFAHAERQTREMLSTRAPRWITQALVIVAILLGFRVAAGLTQRVVRRLIRRAELSQLVRDTIVAWSSRLVMFVGIVVVLRQLGVELGPMLAGVGIAGVVVGFALQDSLSNFAAGGMILAYQPFDVGDIIEAAGVTGTVKKMSLVSTTILTFDNQTLIIPNKKLWGDVICNRTAQKTRRVDLTFGVSYEDSVEHVERLLNEIVHADARIMSMPPPIVRLDKLADSSVNFIVRVWVAQEQYWDVYWDLTRAVKLRFDEEGVRIPYPQRDVHLDFASSAAGARLEVPPPTPPRT
jgi:small conductance mechanosensitive channel